MRLRCPYCKGELKCGNCGKAYNKCKCKVYESQHQNCHKTRSSGRAGPAKAILVSVYELNDRK
jgi:hypothetical protein